MKYIKSFKNKNFKEGVYVKFNNDFLYKYMATYANASNDVFRIESISKPTEQAWVIDIKTGEHFWFLLKSLQLLTELELEVLKYNL